MKGRGSPWSHCRLASAVGISAWRENRGEVRTANELSLPPPAPCSSPHPSPYRIPYPSPYRIPHRLWRSCRCSAPPQRALEPFRHEGSPGGVALAPLEPLTTTKVVKTNGSKGGAAAAATRRATRGARAAKMAPRAAAWRSRSPSCGETARCFPPPPSRTNWTRLVLPPVLTGHVSSHGRPLRALPGHARRRAARLRPGGARARARPARAQDR